MLPRNTPLAVCLAFLAAFCAAVSYGQTQTANPPLAVYSVRTTPKQVNDPISNNKWLQLEVEIGSGNNINPAAPNKNYFERVKVHAIFAWGNKTKGKFTIDTAFDSTVEIAAMPVRSKQYVYFYLPPEVADMYNIRSGQIAFFYVALSYAGVNMPATRASVASSMADSLDSVDSFQQVCAEKLTQTKGMMLPQNLAPSVFRDRAFVSKDMAILVSPVSQEK